MTTPLVRPATMDGLFLWVMHRFAEVFEDHAILKGGMALRLMDSPRFTTDIDYVLIPYASKMDVQEPLESAFAEIEGAAVDVAVHSKMIRVHLSVDDVAIQVEVNVAPQCPSEPMATGSFARQLGQPSRVVRIVRSDWALADKLAAWNERRLLRDLYDGYFLSSRLGAAPNLDRLDHRLARIESRLPVLKGKRSMTRGEFLGALRETLAGLTDRAIHEELGGLFPAEELAGLAVRMRAQLTGLAENMG